MLNCPGNFKSPGNVFKNLSWKCPTISNFKKRILPSSVTELIPGEMNFLIILTGWNEFSGNS